MGKKNVIILGDYEHSFASEKIFFTIFVAFHHLLKTALAILASFSPTLT